MKVVSLALSLSKGISMNLVAASSSENTHEPASLGSMSSRVGKIFPRSTASLRRLSPTHILTHPFFLGTGTIGVHHSVGSVISSINPDLIVEIKVVWWWKLRHG